jgi:outer membrane protein OmpA-like peptidoglycan-associated protein
VRTVRAIERVASLHQTRAGAASVLGAWLTCVLVPAGVASAGAAVDAAAIRPVPGLIITNTEHSNTVSAQSNGVHGYNDLDKETWTSVQPDTPGFITYKLQLSAPANKQADADMKKFKLTRKVRREDLEASNRMTLLVGSDDAETFAGQTFAETSAKTLNLLKSGTDVPFVLGVRDYHASILDSGLAEATKKSSDQGPLSAGTLSSAFFLLGTGRDYYRGKLHRVEAAPVTLAVLVNGERVNLPAIHAAGTFTTTSNPPQQAEFWWLDNPAYPLMLKWNFATANSLVTRIDLPRDADSGGGNGGAGAAAAKLADQLDKSCRLELWGIYFNTGSAQLLDESQPALKSVSAVIKQSKDPHLTVEGHTDNIGAADYNQDLSERRAAAVRQALVTQFGVAADRLSAKGYGLTRPVESNATVEGRAHNRRVELTRPCAAAH